MVRLSSYTRWLDCRHASLYRMPVGPTHAVPTTQNTCRRALVDGVRGGWCAVQQWHTHQQRKLHCEPRDKQAVHDGVRLEQLGAQRGAHEKEVEQRRCAIEREEALGNAPSERRLSKPSGVQCPARGPHQLIRPQLLVRRARRLALDRRECVDGDSAGGRARARRQRSVNTGGAKRACARAYASIGRLTSVEHEAGMNVSSAAITQRRPHIWMADMGGAEG
jgi:hypothetical protein